MPMRSPLPAGARAAAPYDGVVRLPVEGAHEAVGAVVRGAEVAQRRFGPVVGREEALFDEGGGVGRMTGFVEVPQTGKIACGGLSAGGQYAGEAEPQGEEQVSFHGKIGICRFIAQK